MKIPGTCYLVGGAVRNQLLGTAVTERDWVVVGASAEAMKSAGFLQVGASFPVFLHPETHEEYALARTETKSGRGHQGFDTESGSQVSLEQDLQRRDLTVNAMAKNAQGQLIDPHGGQGDLKDRILRHVSEAFCEDPLRCFRVARFAATLPEFEVHDSTLELMRSMVDELSDLSAERVWKEWLRAMDCPQPHRFYEVTREADMTRPWFTDLDMGGLVDFMKEHPNTDGVASIAAVQSLEQCTQFLRRLKSPKRIQKFARLMSTQAASLVDIQLGSASRVLEILVAIRAFRDPAMCSKVIEATASYNNLDTSWIMNILDQLKTVKGSELEGPAAGEDIRRRRLAIISANMKE